MKKKYRKLELASWTLALAVLALTLVFVNLPGTAPASAPDPQPAEDDGIPVEQARLCYNELSNSGGNPNVHYKEATLPIALVPVGKLTGLSVGHMYCGMSFSILLLANEDLSAIWNK